MAMNKKELVTAISDYTGFSKADVDVFLDGQAAVVQAALGDSANAELTLPGIGKLYTKESAARIGRNPRTGESVQIAAKTSVKFSAAKALKDAVA